MQTINVLGRDYTIAFRKEAEDVKLKECGAYCDYSSGEIVIEVLPPDPMNMRDLAKITRQKIRHELVHAFAYESGLAENSPWAFNEEMTDWIAIQFPKMLKAFETAGVLQ